MFEHSSDVADVSASDLVRRDLKEYELDNGKTLSVAQIETVGRAVFERSEELLASAERRRARHDHVLFAVMLTDILAQHTRLLVAGNESLAERAFGEPVVDGAIELPGVMSRKKQVAPGLLAAASGGQRLRSRDLDAVGPDIGLGASLTPAAHRSRSGD